MMEDLTLLHYMCCHKTGLNPAIAYKVTMMAFQCHLMIRLKENQCGCNRAYFGLSRIFVHVSKNDKRQNDAAMSVLRMLVSLR